MTDGNEIAKIKEIYSSSRAAVMTQIFVTIATADGVGIAAVLSMISQNMTSKLMIPYLVTIVFLLALSFIVILISILLRFRHSRFAEKEDIAEIEKNSELKSHIRRRRMPYYYGYTAAIYISIALLFSALITGMIGTYRVYTDQISNLSEAKNGSAAETTKTSP